MILNLEPPLPLLGPEPMTLCMLSECFATELLPSDFQSFLRFVPTHELNIFAEVTDENLELEA